MSGTNPNPDPNPNETTDVRQLREALSRRDQKIADLETQVSTFRSAALAGVAHQAGFNPNSGPVKLVMEKFEAELTADKLSPQAFTEYAKVWELEPAQQQQQQQQPQQQATQQQNPPASDPQQQAQQQQAQQQAQQVQTFQAPADQLLAASTAAQPGLNPDPSDLNGQIAQAEAQGNWDRSLALKLQALPSVPDGFNQSTGTGVNPNTNLPTHTPPQ
jgi:hypothetical protein